MYKKIMVPVDLAHTDRLDRALETSGALARQFDCPVTYVGVTASAPSEVAHTPEEYAERLAAFADNEGVRHGIKVDAKAMVVPDPKVDIEAALVRAISETGADLVVMATHVPGLSDRIWPSNGGAVANHSDVSVFLVRS